MSASASPALRRSPSEPLPSKPRCEARQLTRRRSARPPPKPTRKPRTRWKTSTRQAISVVIWLEFTLGAPCRPRLREHNLSGSREWGNGSAPHSVFRASHSRPNYGPDVSRYSKNPLPDAPRQLPHVAHEPHHRVQGRRG